MWVCRRRGWEGYFYGLDACHVGILTSLLVWGCEFQLGLGDIMVFSCDTVFFLIPLSRYKYQDTAIFVAHAQ